MPTFYTDSGSFNDVSATGSALISGSLIVSGASYFPTLGVSTRPNIVSVDIASGQLFYVATSSINAATASFITASNVWGPLGSSSVASASFASSSTSASFASSSISASYASSSTSASFATTASYANFALSSSYASSSTSASFATTASYANFALSASYASSSTSASFATTASYANFALSSSYASSSTSASYASSSTSASYASSSTSASYATVAASVLGGQTTQGTLSQSAGIVQFSFNGGSNATVAVSGASSLTVNKITRWTGAAFTNSSLEDTGTSITGSVSIQLTGASSSLTGSFTGSLTGSLFGTASWAQSASNAINTITASYVTGSIHTGTNPALTASYASSSTSASFATTASYANFALSSSYASSSTSASFATTSSYTNFALSASYASSSTSASNALTASYTLFALSSSYASSSTSASNALTASYTLFALSASYASSSTSASNALTASYTLFALSASYASSSTSASNALTASYTLFALSASYASSSTSASNALTASYALFALSSSYASSSTSASFATTSSYTNFALSASYASSSTSASFATTASYVTGSIHTGTNPALTASFATTASYVTGSIHTGTNPALTASYALFALSASYASSSTSASNALTASYALFALSSSYASSSTSASFATTSSYTNFALSASYASSSTSASFATTASYTLFALSASYASSSTSASFATTASYVTGSVHTGTNPALTASYALFALSASYASSSTSASNALTASYALFALSSSYASSSTSASFATTSSYTNFALSASYASSSTSASYASASTSASFALSTSFAISSSYPMAITGTTIYSTNRASAINPSPSNNVFVGFNAGNANTSDNISIGQSAGSSGDTINSVLIGRQVAVNATTASYSIIIGFNAGFNPLNGRGNIIIGNGGVTVPTSASRALNIGGLIFGTGSYLDLSGNPFSGSADGKIGINEPNPTYSFQVAGTVGFPGLTTGATTNNIVLLGANGQLFYTASTWVGGTSVFPHTGNAVITGSLTITGSGLIVSGSTTSTLGFTGSLFGTASYVTGSVHTGTNPALTASYASASTSASYALNSTSASYASSSTSASYTLTASQVENGVARYMTLWQTATRLTSSTALYEAADGKLLLGRGFSTAGGQGDVQISGSLGVGMFTGTAEIRTANYSDSVKLRIIASELKLAGNQSNAVGYADGGIFSAVSNGASVLHMDVGSYTSTPLGRFRVLNNSGGNRVIMGLSSSFGWAFVANQTGGPDGSGSVGINIANGSPTSTLHVSGTVEFDGLANTSQANFLAYNASTGNVTYAGTGSFTAATATTASYITSSFFTGVNTALSSSYASSSTSASFALTSSNVLGGADRYITRWIGNTVLTRSIIYEAANPAILINTTTAQANGILQVSGSIGIIGNHQIRPAVNDGSTTLDFIGTSLTISGSTTVTGSTSLTGSLSVFVANTNQSNFLAYNTNGAVTYFSTSSLFPQSASYASASTSASYALTASKIEGGTSAFIPIWAGTSGSGASNQLTNSNLFVSASYIGIGFGGNNIANPGYLLTLYRRERLFLGVSGETSTSAGVLLGGYYSTSSNTTVTQLPTNDAQNIIGTLYGPIAIDEVSVTNGDMILQPRSSTAGKIIHTYKGNARQAFDQTGVRFSGSFTNVGNATITGSLTAIGATTINGNTTITGSFTLSGSTHVISGSSLAISGASSVSGTFTIIGTSSSFVAPAPPRINYTGSGVGVIVSGTTRKFYGSGITVIPRKSGVFFFQATGYATISTADRDGEIQIKFGTGSAPTITSNIASGSYVGNTLSLTSATSQAFVPFTVASIVEGLTIGTTYWFDIAYAPTNVADSMVMYAPVYTGFEL